MSLKALKIPDCVKRLGLWEFLDLFGTLTTHSHHHHLSHLGTLYPLSVPTYRFQLAGTGTLLFLSSVPFLFWPPGRGYFTVMMTSDAAMRDRTPASRLEGRSSTTTPQRQLGGKMVYITHQMTFAG